MPVDARVFYSQYQGHDTALLEQVVTRLRDAAGPRGLIFLLGDSSLDNKHWLSRCSVPCAPQLHAILSPPVSTPDVAHALNVALAADDTAASARYYACVNFAIEESTLGARSAGLLPQDAALARLLTPRDALCVSVGGNDIVLRPSCATVAAVGALLLASPNSLESGSALGLPQLVNLFRDDTQQFIERVCARAAPRACVVCSIYAPAQAATEPSWADCALSLMGYGVAPHRLQRALAAVHAHGTARVAPPVPSTRVAPLALASVLDASDPLARDYVARVEPSALGGTKIAAAVLQILEGLDAAT